MSQQSPPQEETPEERLERISKMPGVVVRRRVGPPSPYVPTLAVNPGVTVKEILGYDDDDDDDRDVVGS